jgi:hypothetical protein
VTPINFVNVSILFDHSMDPYTYVLNSYTPNCSSINVNITHSTPSSSDC